MAHRSYFPHIDIVLRALRINRLRLDSSGKIAIDARLLKALIQAAVERQPFSEAFYFETYPDLQQAAAAGQLGDAHRHFVDTGYFEGRVGIAPEVDEDFYAALYPDVAEAVAGRRIESLFSHYVASGVAEGRVPSAAAKPEIDSWMALLRQYQPQ